MYAKYVLLCAMRNFTLIFSLLLNSVLVALIGFAIVRLGGWQYALYRFGRTEAGLYEHRVELFKQFNAPEGSIVMLGDSQIEQCEWQELLRPKTSQLVLNRGITGDHVTGVLARLEEINRLKPAKIFICLGINDLLFGQSLDHIEANYRNIIRQLRSANASAQVYVISVLPVNNETRRIGVENRSIQELNLRLRQLARTFAIPFIDLYSVTTNAKGDLSGLLSADGLHLNGQGYNVWLKMMEPYLK
jgi:lysophospholipase L1-like esterase